MQKITIVKTARVVSNDPPPRACTWVIEDFATGGTAPQR